jgi:hypothetical protein
VRGTIEDCAVSVWHLLEGLVAGLEMLRTLELQSWELIDCDVATLREEMMSGHCEKVSEALWNLFFLLSLLAVAATRLQNCFL